MTLREQAQSAIEQETENAERYQHARNYHKLHIYRDGGVQWSEYLNRSDDTIDERATHFAPIPSVITAGTGAFACNCDYCDMIYDARDEAEAKVNGVVYNPDTRYETAAEAIQDAIANADLSAYERDMLGNLGAIPAGYFDDEKAEEL